MVSFLKIPVQRTISKQVTVSKTQESLENARPRSHRYIPGQFLSNILLVKKKDGGNRAYINLKDLNKFIPYKHFKIEGLHCLKYPLEVKDFLCKIDLKDAFFSVPLCMSSRKFERFAW